jgi:hypothetical protein
LVEAAVFSTGSGQSEGKLLQRERRPGEQRLDLRGPRNSGNLLAPQGSFEENPDIFCVNAASPQYKYRP